MTNKEFTDKYLTPPERARYFANTDPILLGRGGYAYPWSHLPIFDFSTSPEGKEYWLEIYERIFRRCDDDY
jgi:hypothetical protein